MRKRIVAGGALAIGLAGVFLMQAGEGTGPVQIRPDGKWFCAYPDPATKNDPIKRGAPWTIGYGHTGPDVYKGLCIPEKQADALFEKDAGIARDALAGCVTAPVHRNEEASLTSITMNAGGRNICPSTLVRKVNARDYAGAANEFPRWVYANRKRMPGLVWRRECERRLFLTDPDKTTEAETLAMVKACILKSAA